MKEFLGRPVGDLVLRGKEDELRAYEPLTVERYAHPATKAYLAAFALLEARDLRAMPAFASLLSASPHDPLATFHLKRLLNGGQGTRLELL